MCLKRGIRERWFGPNSKEIPIDKTTSSGRNNKSKILRVLKFVKERVMTADEIEIWLNKKIPSREDPVFASWEASLGTFAISAEKRSMQKLLALEKERGLVVKKGTNLVSGISKRIEDIEKTAQ